MNLLTGEAGLGEFRAGWPQGIAPLGLLQIRVSQVPRSICRHPPSSTTPGSPTAALARCLAVDCRLRPFGKVGHSQLLGFKAVRKNYFSNLDDDDGAKWSSSNPARPSEA